VFIDFTWIFNLTEVPNSYFIFYSLDGWVIETDVLGCLFYCPKMCGRKYKSKRAVKLHMKYECGVKPQFQCNICGKNFKQPIHHKSHMLAIHKILAINKYR